MKIIIPVSETDEPLIKDFCNVVKYLGPYKSHNLLVVCRPSDSKFGLQVLMSLKNLFGSFDFHIFDEDGERGWPSGPNFYWYNTIKHLILSGNQDPWLWLEADMTPLKLGWIDTLENEYKNCGKPCMGWVEDTTTVTKYSRKIVKLTKHLVGAAIYPPNLNKFCSTWENVWEIDTAFDIICQWELVPNSFHSSLFQHSFRTKEYTENRHTKIIKGIDDNNFPDGLSFDQPLSEEAVIHHGCIDGSLAKIILSKPKIKFLTEPLTLFKSNNNETSIRKKMIEI